MKEAKLKEVDDLQNHFLFLMKWRYVKENLVYNKNSGEDIGSVNMGDLNEQVLEQQQACKYDVLWWPNIFWYSWSEGSSPTFSLIVPTLPSLTPSQITFLWL